MADTSREPKRIIPALGPFYDSTRDLSWLVIRVTAGGMLLAHGITKLTTSSIAGFASASLARRGIEPSIPLAYVVFFLETSARSASSSGCSRARSRSRSESSS